VLDLYKQVGNSLSALRQALRIAISNADNFNTPGYKYTYASFTSVYSELLSPGSEFKNPMNTGGSMTLGSTTTDFTQGNINYGTKLNCAVVGEGFFMLSKSASEFGGESSKLYTRNGSFQVDFNNQYLTDAFGRKVYGYKLTASGGIASTDPLPIETGGNTDIGFIDGGILVTNYQKYQDDIAAGTTPPAIRQPLFRLTLSSFQNKQGLTLGEGGTYMRTAASGEPLNPGMSGESIYGNILAERLESSNIDVAKVALDMNLLNRGFSAIQGVIDDIGKVYNGLITKLS
jgi:flagellar hook protein FlgE